LHHGFAFGELARLRFEKQPPAGKQNGPSTPVDEKHRPALRAMPAFVCSLESWQNGYCTSLENWRP